MYCYKSTVLKRMNNKIDWGDIPLDYENAIVIKNLSKKTTKEDIFNFISQHTDEVCEIYFLKNKNKFSKTSTCKVKFWRGSFNTTALLNLRGVMIRGSLIEIESFKNA